MANRITQAERQRIYRRAAQLYAQHGNRQGPAVQALIAETGISKDRARGAVSHAAMRARRPNRAR